MVSSVLPAYSAETAEPPHKHGFAKSLKAHAVLYEQNQFHDISVSRDMNIKQFWKYVRRSRNNQNTTSVIHDTDNIYNTPEQQLTMWENTSMEF